jgi:hypothetical protein
MSGTTSNNLMANHPSSGVVIDDPSAYVDGLTLTQWTEQWFRWAVPTPGGPIDASPNVPIDAFNDPTGSVAKALNQGFSPMYFITDQAMASNRTFDVPFGKSVLVPIGGVADSEGPNLAPGDAPAGPPTGTYADEVKAVLATATFNYGTARLDGGPTVTLPVINSGIFDAGVAWPGSAGADFFGEKYPVPTLLQTTGDEGYWVMLQGLSPGQHSLTISWDISFNGQARMESLTDTINVVLPT